MFRISPHLSLPFVVRSIRKIINGTDKEEGYRGLDLRSPKTTLLVESREVIERDFRENVTPKTTELGLYRQPIKDI